MCNLIAIKLMLILDWKILNLDSHMINIVFFFASFSYFFQHKHRIILASDMGTQCKFAHANRPQMEIMNFNSIMNLFDIPKQLLHINFFWWSFHKHLDTVFANWIDSDAYNYGEYICANWVCDCCWGNEIYNQGCDYYSDTHYHIA